ncbi:MAG TPA: pantoate--beta-alanine ligase [Isosphaeraceae bacterium]|jgi:pantoate--beta-alanine ligase|nr:pantoate--beta-alanine ligase [Isosphaeraceae bacterium]
MSSSLKTLGRIEDVRASVREARQLGHAIGLVPTMGALHDGHVRLIEACRREAPFVVVSIFVNPTQFGPAEDYRKYPRTLDADAERCQAGGASVIFAPGVETMYPNGATSTFVEVPGLSTTLEGSSRPGHFRGVATVVLKLLEIVGPDVAYFGEKDYQQLLVIRRMVHDLTLPVTIRSVPTVREADGLAMSSRNRYLNAEEHRAATVLSRALGKAVEAVAAGERSADRVRQILRETVESESMARLDYAEVADAETLEPLTELRAGRPGVALLAAWVGPARLIDNRALPL